MVAYIPYMIMGVEALLAGVTAAYAVHATGGDLNASLVAGVTALLAKVLPTQVTAKKP